MTSAPIATKSPTWTPPSVGSPQKYGMRALGTIVPEIGLAGAGP